MRKLFIITILLFSSYLLQAQDGLLRKSLTGYTDFSWKTADRDSIFWSAAVGTVVSSGDIAPYHIWTNRGCISSRPNSLFGAVTLRKEYSAPKHIFDYSFRFQPSMGYSGGNKVKTLLKEGYVAARIYVFELTAGRRHSDNHGYFMSDADLTSGGMLFSRNALPVPRVSLATAGYVPFPFSFGYLEVKGGLTHGWLGSSGYVDKALLHHKYLGARIGGRLPVNLSYEFHHAAQWGGISPDYGPLGSTFKDFMNTFFARSGGVMANDQLNAQGNHLCSQVIGLDIKLDGWKGSAYWQTISEDGPIDLPWKALNASDGLWGVSVTTPFPYVSGILYEYLRTSNQSGAFHDRDGIVYGGGDSYYNNGIYRNGWTYKGYTIGHPLIISPVALPNGAISPYITRMRSHHAGIRGDIKGYGYRTLATFTRLYDSYEYPTDTFNRAFLLEVSKRFEALWGLNFKLSFAADSGTQFGNSYGIMLTVAKTGLLWSR